jgi:hypothetical protein
MPAVATSICIALRTATTAAGSRSNLLHRLLRISAATHWLRTNKQRGKPTQALLPHYIHSSSNSSISCMPQAASHAVRSDASYCKIYKAAAAAAACHKRHDKRYTANHAAVKLGLKYVPRFLRAFFFLGKDLFCASILAGFSTDWISSELMMRAKSALVIC